MADVLLEARGLTKAYRMAGSDLPVLRGADIAVTRGEVLAVVGRSGVGKSTLLHVLGILDAPDAGTLHYAGQDLAGASAARRATVRNAEFGFVFQFYHLLPEFTALENVLMSAWIGKSLTAWWRTRTAARARARTLLERVGLGERLTHRPSQLSGGEQQRVAIARALMNDPKILFCDEPTGNLDPTTAADVMNLLFDLNGERGQTCVLVTHDDQIARQAHRIARMVDGRIAEITPGAGRAR